MADLIIRPATEADLPAVGSVTVEAYVTDGFVGAHDGYATVLADAESRFRAAELLVAQDESGTVLGSVTVVRPGTPYAEISRPGELEFRMLAVSAAARGRGVGEALVRAVFDRARAAGATHVVLSSSEKMLAAHRLYERLGFTRLPERDWTPLPGVNLVAYAYGTPL
ncbi:Ribosomal protein S18 acetylase RimI [Lentzea albidocapillata subsp. violacea]|uniref:Ribosomal protein S18 acetylase RimI n=1 Tax=Lentzea albidocapillata subsp. violacea TaxID=128104 RepID=A0A1G9KDM8_9PSEU|nr:GNAT family N-acetyltransferase [Lentzea albidocapillata]SDL47433.1 Ribosomal protein S18 acetylase RimI [Lentzea albidocapillata subsp. violacea]